MTYPATPTFWLEPTGTVQVGLRRYARQGGDTGWTCADGWHQALAITGVEPAQLDERGYLTLRPETPHDDPRWPTTCDAGCGYEFTDADHWQDWQDRLYRRTDTGEETTLRDAAPGACWDARWMPDDYRGPDGIALTVRCPNGHDWCVDSQASNCTRKGEPHACWVRHGDPRACQVTVDKNGDTCAAGAGSIIAGDYHGFLQSGVLTAG